MRILIIEDDRELREFLKRNLQIETFTVDTAGDGEEGSYMGRTHEYDLILMDNNMPKKNGLEVCKDIRSSGKTTPIIMVSIQSEIGDKISLLNSGADDYITKPFSYKELSSRIRAILRRPHSIILPTLKIEDFTLDTMTQRAFRGRKDIYLTRKEFALTEYLMRNAGSIVSRATLIEHVWDDDLDPFSNTIESHILNLRKKIDLFSNRKIIHTVPGRGYKIDSAEYGIHA
ncbi:MAG: hypothetical protein RLZZ67_639 [Candidatus Parcubacteria bacterium]|jgi:DNA-binding response OmpR family regulator